MPAVLGWHSLWLYHVSMSIIDINGILSFFDLDVRKPDASGKLVVGEHLSYERKVSFTRSSSQICPTLSCCLCLGYLGRMRGT
jgi:hypothetical protein